MIEVLGDKIKPAASAEESSSSVAPASSSAAAPASSASVASSSSRSHHRSSSSHNPSSSPEGVIVIPNATSTLSVGNVSFDGVTLQMPLTLARAGMVNIRLYSVLGNEVVNLSETMSAGTNSLSISKKLSPGIYMLRVQAGSSLVTKRIDLSK